MILMILKVLREKGKKIYGTVYSFDSVWILGGIIYKTSQKF